MVKYHCFLSRGGGMADAQVSKTCGALNLMWVRLPPSALIAFVPRFPIDISLNPSAWFLCRKT
jgi:hypothetical protein